MTRRMHALFLPLVFPSGIALGEGGDFNLLTIARNGNGDPVLRGTALAGALRHAYRRFLQATNRHDNVDVEVAKLFGFAPENESRGGKESRLRVSDCVLRTGSSSAALRTHHMRNRHTGTVVDGGLFSVEACPPNTKTTAALFLREDESFIEVGIDSQQVLESLYSLLTEGLTLGGNSARGVGAVAIDAAETVYRCYDLSKAKELASWLDDDRNWRANAEIPSNGRAIESNASATDEILKVEFTLAIPRGQDILVGDGQGLDHEIEPQRIIDADGQLFWRLPGASLRGIFRAWVSRLAARGETVEKRPVDSVRRHLDHDRHDGSESFSRNDPSVLTGDNLGWCFLPSERRQHGKAKTDCPVAGLFGSLFQAGRIHISDGYAKCSSNDLDAELSEEQLRMHVAVDRITGGAAESMLFDNTVLTSYASGNSPEFNVTMRVQNPSDKEAEWLSQTLRALDLGILRVGSSKSSGRLELIKLRADGREKHAFAELQQLVEEKV